MGFYIVYAVLFTYFDKNKKKYILVVVIKKIVKTLVNIFQFRENVRIINMYQLADSMHFFSCKKIQLKKKCDCSTPFDCNSLTEPPW